jgi:hypothetical protein
LAACATTACIAVVVVRFLDDGSTEDGESECLSMAAGVEEVGMYCTGCQRGWRLST